MEELDKFHSAEHNHTLSSTEVKVVEFAYDPVAYMGRFRADLLQQRYTAEELANELVNQYEELLVTVELTPGLVSKQNEDLQKILSTDEALGNEGRKMMFRILKQAGSTQLELTHWTKAHEFKKELNEVFDEE